MTPTKMYEPRGLPLPSHLVEWLRDLLAAYGEVTAAEIVGAPRVTILRSAAALPQYQTTHRVVEAAYERYQQANNGAPNA